MLQDDQQPCFLTNTSPATNELVRANAHLSVHVSGTDSKGPRYCPSIETKVAKHPHLTAHNIWLEPDGYPTETGASPLSARPYFRN